MKCRRCKAPAAVALPSHHTGFCPECFLVYFSRQIERAIHEHKLLTPDDKVLLAVSGGKDSLALTLALKELGYDVTALHVHLDIENSSEAAAASVVRFCERFEIKHFILRTAEHGLSIPMVKRTLKRPICSACGKIKRYFFNRYAFENGYTVLGTGHNLDDEVSRLFANTLRWDKAYLGTQGPISPAEGKFVRKIKPLYRLSEYETATYCFLRGLDYAMGACPFSGGASFTAHKKLLAELEHRSPGQKFAFYENFLGNARPLFQQQLQNDGGGPVECARCGYPCMSGLCGVCSIKEQVAEKIKANPGLTPWEIG